MIKNKIKKIIAEFIMIDSQEINDEDFLKELGIDSLMTVELILKIEDSFNILFNDSELNPENLVTVKSLVELVEKH